jgi:hypothetical protein
MAHLVKATALQKREKLMMRILLRQTLNLARVMPIDEGLNRLDGGEYGPRSEEGRNGASQKSSDTPERKKGASGVSRQDRLDQLQMLLFSLEMSFGKRADLITSGDGKNAAIDGNGARFSSMVGTQVANEPSRKSSNTPGLPCGHHRLELRAQSKEKVVSTVQKPGERPISEKAPPKLKTWKCRPKLGECSPTGDEGSVRLHDVKARERFIFREAGGDVTIRSTTHIDP